jgi:hypothetical protein
MDDDNNNDTVAQMLLQLANAPLWYDEGDVKQMRKGPLQAFCRWVSRGTPYTISTIHDLLVKHGMNDFKVKFLIASSSKARAPMEDSREDTPIEYADARGDAPTIEFEYAREDAPIELLELKAESAEAAESKAAETKA